MLWLIVYKGLRWGAWSILGSSYSVSCCHATRVAVRAQVHGVLVKGLGLSRRAVFVVDEHERLVRMRCAAEQVIEPGYDVRSSLRSGAGVTMLLLLAVGLLSFVG